MDTKWYSVDIVLLNGQRLYVSLSEMELLMLNEYIKRRHLVEDIYEYFFNPDRAISDVILIDTREIVSVFAQLSLGDD